jgi:hypothetical protein
MQLEQEENTDQHVRRVPRDFVAGFDRSQGSREGREMPRHCLYRPRFQRIAIRGGQPVGDAVENAALLLKQREQRELLRARRPHVRVEQRLDVVALGDELVALAASVFVLLYQ